MSKLAEWWSGGVDKVFGFDRQNQSEGGRCSLYGRRSSAPASTAPLLRAQINACIPCWERKLDLRDSLEVLRYYGVGSQEPYFTKYASLSGIKEVVYPKGPAPQRS
jgi:hypothetical protein